MYGCFPIATPGHTSYAVSPIIIGIAILDGLIGTIHRNKASCSQCLSGTTRERRREAHHHS
jgi:hypothetical protein